jgi:uncharacterized NAD(P)/FAD-binding protein YdhS
VNEEEAPQPKVRDVARWLRERSRTIDWRSAVDSLRPHSHRLWQSMPLAEKRLFLRYGRPWWDIHRHRIAPQVRSRIDRLVEEGRLEVLAGRITGVQRTGASLEVTYRKRGKNLSEPARQFGYIFNCTGPLADITRTDDPLLLELLEGGDVKADELAIGLQTDDRARAGEHLWAVGTLTKGRYWEIIAVPDIRVQAAAVADDIVTELGQ